MRYLLILVVAFGLCGCSSKKNMNDARNNLRQLMYGLINHEGATRHFPPPAIQADDGTLLLSWRVKILPYIEQQALYEQFHLDEPWDSEHNKQLIGRMPAIYASPGIEENQAGLTHFQMFTGEGTFLGESEPSGATQVPRIGGIIFLVEADEPVIWTKPQDYEAAGDQDFRGLGKLRGGVFNAVYGDGHVSEIEISAQP